VDSKKYEFSWHAWVKDGEMSSEKIYEREIKRLPRLAEFLIENLTAGHRIFVRTPGPGDTPADRAKIQAAVRKYGPAQVLFIERDPTRTGVVLRQPDGLLIGYIDEFSNPAGVNDTTRTESWLKICRNALQMVTQAG
jgi:hypothetical protein